MATLEQLLARREILTASRATGTLVVQFPDGTRIQYREDAELAAQIAFVDREIASLQGVPRPSRFYFTTSKGL